MLYLVLQLGLGPADAAIYQHMLGNTVAAVKTSVHNQILVHSETEEQKLRRNIRAVSSVAHLH